MRELELLAPARDAEIGRVAILAGADAVYIGAPEFGARAAATNDVDAIANLVAFAHRYRAKVYVTLNTILYDDELERAQQLVWKLYSIGVDALIVQDMAYLEMSLPPIALHASTQCDIRTPEKARLLAQAGFSQLVLPREFSLEQIKACKDAAGVPVEVFVHGALCVSYSGDCQAGYVAMGRSANRGECPQMCRLPYLLTDAAGNVLGKEKHYLSLRDLNRIDSLQLLIEAGASSFKIEGRLKDARYVANVTAAYSQALNSIIAASKGRYTRGSVGKSEYGFVPDVNRTFNRGYTNYFLRKPDHKERMASLNTPKWVGAPVAKVLSVSRNADSFKVALSAELANGDGLGYFDKDGRFVGFRLNKIDKDTLYPATSQPLLSAGTVLYRNNDKVFFELLDSRDASCRRTIAVDFVLKNIDEERFSMLAADARGCSATIVVESPYQQAKTPQNDARKRILSRLGDTIYSLRSVDDRLSDRFVSASTMAAARRELIEMLDANAEAVYHYERRGVSQLNEEAFEPCPPLTYHDNVANKLSLNFYRRHGARISQKAIEVERNRDGETIVMTTKYCIRRELGACLKDHSSATKLPAELFLRNASGVYRIDFDCGRCGMSIVKIS